MTNKLFAVVLGGIGIVACGGGSTPPATEPSAQTNTTTAPASPTGGCGAPKDITASTMDACKADCQKLDDKAPEGSRCVPPRTQCMMNCDSKFKK